MKKLLIFLFLAVSLQCVLSQPDDSAPEFFSAWFDPASAANGETVDIYIKAYDEGSGIWFIMPLISSPTNASFVSTNDTLFTQVSDSVYKQTISFSKWAENGEWFLFSISIWDSSLNVYMNAYPVSALSPATIMVNSTTPDITAPVFDSAFFDPATVTNEDTLNLFVYAQDDVSGIFAIAGFLQSDDDTITGTIDYELYVAGDQHKLKIPTSQLTDSGSWYLSGIAIYDSALNVFQEVYLDAGSSPATFNVEESSSDETDPVFLAAWFDPDTIVDESFFTLYIQTYDDGSGISTINTTIKSPEGTTENIGSFLLDSDSVYKRNISTAILSDIGTWYLSNITITDNASNTYNNSYANSSVSPATLFIDIDIPETPIDSVWFDKDTVANGDIITVFIRVDDTLPGLREIYLNVESPDGKSISPGWGASVKVSDYVCKSEIKISEWATSGNWFLDNIGFYDIDNNYYYYFYSNILESPGSFYVNSSSSDTIDPVLDDIWCEPTIILSENDKVTIYMKAHDDLSGVFGFNTEFKSASGETESSGWSEKINDSIFKCTINSDYLVSLGTWYLSILDIDDSAQNNNRIYYSDSIESPVSFKVVTSLSDTTKPILDSVWFVPDTPPNSFTLYVSTHDEISSISTISTIISSPGGNIQISGDSYILADKFLYKKEFEYPLWTEPGYWYLSNIIISDASDNEFEAVYSSSNNSQATFYVSPDTVKPVFVSAWFDSDTITTNDVATLYIKAYDSVSGINTLSATINSLSATPQSVSLIEIVSDSLYYWTSSYPAGTWYLSNISITDNADNNFQVSYLNISESPAKFVSQLPVDVNNEINTENTFKVYPIPFSELLTIESKELIVAIKIISISGQEIATKQTNDYTYMMSMDAPSGVYFLKVQTIGTTKTIKIQKK